MLENVITAFFPSPWMSWMNVVCFRIGFITKKTFVRFCV